MTRLHRVSRAPRALVRSLCVAALAACSPPRLDRDSATDGALDASDAQSALDALDAISEDRSAPSDARDSDAFADVRCAASETACDGRCVDTRSSATHCGACGNRCGSGRTCEQSACVIACVDATHRINDTCVANGGVRPITPISLGDTSLRAPRLRFALPAGADGAVIELCRDRACTMVIETLRVTASEARPTAPLPASSVVFWRGRARVGTHEDTVANSGPTWLFHTPARDNSNAIDTSTNPHLDVNGDGFDDVVIGAPRASSASYAGTVSVFHGGASGPVWAPTIVLEGESPRGRFGAIATQAGDVNGDGFGDLLVTAPEISVERGTRVFHGSMRGLSATRTALIEIAIPGAVEQSVASAGDVDADGYADVIIGTPTARLSPTGPWGCASIFHGSASGLRATASWQARTEGGALSELFGASVASAGDVNGDGYSDVIVGAPFPHIDALSAPGRTRVFHGSARGVTPYPQSAQEGESRLAHFGTSVASAGDVNGDGYSDVVIGAPLTSDGALDRVGSVTLYLGSTSGVRFLYERRLLGRSTADNFGRVVAFVGDVDGDGYSEFALQSERAREQVTLVFGSSTRTQVFESIDSALAYGRGLGSGDVNGDGHADLLIGDPRYGSVGQAWLFLANSGGIDSRPAWSAAGASVDDEFGQSVGR